MSKQELSLLDHVKLFFLTKIPSKTKPNYILYRCPKHGVVECKQYYRVAFSCPECDKE